MSSQDRVLPHNLEAERSVLGAVLIQNEAIGPAFNIIQPDDFFRDAHRRIFEKMIVLAQDERTEAIDLVTLKEALSQAGELDQVGGPLTSPRWSTAFHDRQTSSTYARIVKEKSTLRSLIHAGTQIAQRAWEAEDDPGVILEDAGRTLHSIAEETERAASATGLPEDALADAVDVAAEGRQLAVEGVPQLVAGLIPYLGMLGFLIAFAKVGKTTLSHATAASVAMGREFLDRATVRARVLVIAAEDPPRYTAWVARHLSVDPGWMTFYRKSIVVDPRVWRRLLRPCVRGRYGFERSRRGRRSCAG